MDFIDLYDRGSAWAATKVEGAAGHLDAQTPCEKWKVRDVINHLLDGSRYFQASVQGNDATPPSPDPPDVLADRDPGAAHEEARQATLHAFKDADAEKAGFSMGIAFADQLVHGWDIAAATGQDTAMPADLAEAAYGMVSGNLTSERRGNAFHHEVKVSDDASVQDKLLGYMGRQPAA